ncbi:MAG TPA: cytochrome c biogenesis protein CcsA [Bdellovibrionota bacterium]|nr:cytochrome c biogenesis protein CcsA [Bdellovibrionota bacterium]
MPEMKFLELAKKNRVFQFMASVKMAVPLMLGLAVIVAIGTVVESRYNAQFAGILVYRSSWFEALMVLLWINILFATLARFPFKKKHTGFVITHIGLLALLAGGMITGRYGIDGQLRIVEGQSGNRVVLPELTLEVGDLSQHTIASYPIKRGVEMRTGSGLQFSGLKKAGLVVEKFLPFVFREQSYMSAPASSDIRDVAVNFSLKGPMFGPAGDWLHSKDRPEGQMGPTLFRLVVDGPAGAPNSKIVKERVDPRMPPKGEQGGGSGALLIVKDTSGAELAKISLSDLKRKSRSVKGVTISLVKTYEQAVVAENQLVDQGGKGVNPAIELKLQQGRDGKPVREISFANYPDFSLNGGASLGVLFQYVPGNELSETQIEFRVSSQDPSRVTLALLKDGKRTFSKAAKAGEIIETPWMPQGGHGGIKIAVESIIPRAILTDSVQPIEIAPGAALPESAIFVRPESPDSPQNTGIWLVEGDFKTLRAGPKTYELHYGSRRLDLPFSLALEKFEKIDYPGSEMPMSFQSTVRVNGEGEPVLISMNEPLKYLGYTLYQSSYELGQGGPSASIFSVNKDPGRPVKYAGSLILCVGIMIFSIMKSEWYKKKHKGDRMKKFFPACVGILLFAGGLPFAQAEQPGSTVLSVSEASARFKAFAAKIDSAAVAEAPLQSRGRVKPFDSFARETIVFLTGKYSMSGLDAGQIYLALMTSDVAQQAEIVNVRDPELRTELGLTKARRHYSLQELESSRLEELAKPALMKQERNARLSARDKATLELMQQVWLSRGVISGRHLIDGLTFPGVAEHRRSGSMADSLAGSPAIEQAQQYLRALSAGDETQARQSAAAFLAAAKAQPMPELFSKNLGKLGLEVWYNHAHIFFWTAIAYLLLGIALIIPHVRKRLGLKTVLGITAIPLMAHIAGFAVRVVITGFAPVTNMYGTMVWVAFGLVLFGAFLFLMYRNYAVMGGVLIGAAATLLLTENLPLVLSPDMDPIVAVLRNNFWLTIHVLTITISYAAFTIAMLIGNAALIRGIISGLRGSRSSQALQADEAFYKEYGNLTYRVIQIGVFFLTAGIILGGIWADYSWGRFWGWDPKETWSLIADLGYLSILHAKYLGWLNGFGILAASPVGYLLVVMAWYGVNFILAAGLHSYGFSSGGAAMVGAFVGVQLALLGVALAVQQFRRAQAVEKVKS